jgi:hypothetical protein
MSVAEATDLQLPLFRLTDINSGHAHPAAWPCSLLEI